MSYSSILCWYMKKTVAFIIPAYNEGSVIVSVLTELINKLKKQNDFEFKIIVVNDGSKDDTEEQLSKFKEIYQINHILNSGAGAATRTALSLAKKMKVDAAVSLDADGQHLPDDAIKVANETLKGKYDLVIGSRLSDNEGMLWYRKLGNLGLSFFTFLLFGSTVIDSQSGLRGYGVKAINNISFHSNNFTFNSELMWRAKQQKLSIKEIPISAIYTDYSLAKGQSNWNAIPIFRQLIKRRLLEFFDE